MITARIGAAEDCRPGPGTVVVWLGTLLWRRQPQRRCGNLWLALGQTAGAVARLKGCEIRCRFEQGWPSP